MLQKGKQTNVKYKEKFGILSSIRDHRKKSRDTREVACTCRCTSEHLRVLCTVSRMASEVSTVGVY